MRKVLRAAVVLLSAVGVVVGAAVIGTGSEVSAKLGPPPENNMFGGVIPDYPGALPTVPVSDGMEMNGLRMNVGYFLTDDSPSDVRQFYADAFSEEGLEVHVTEDQEAGGGVTAWDTRRGHQRSIMVLLQGGQTAVFPAVTPLGMAPRQEDRPLPPAPTGSRLVSDVVAKDGAAASRTISLITESLEEDAITDLRRRLALQGYELQDTQEMQSAAVVEAVAPGGVRLTYTVSGSPDRPTGVVIVMRDPMVLQEF